MKKIILLKFLLVFSIVNAQLNFSSKTIMENVNATEGVATIQSFDIDGDGDKDLLSGDLYNVKWFENIGGNNTQLISHKIADFGANFCSFADIDKDNDLDVIVQSNSSLYWIQNNDGHGNFNQPNLLISGSNIYSISIVDFDLDNDLDILYSYSNFNNSGLSWLENTTGQGNFSNKMISQNSNSRAIYAVDIDKDNDIDIFSFNNSSQKIERFTNNGLLSFTTQIITNAKENGYGTINFADIDNDNDLDLIASNSAGFTNSIEELKVFKNDGFGNQTLFKTLVTNGIGVSYIITKDIDNDNDLDIVLSCYNDDKLSWFKNNDGQGNFGSIQVINNKLNGAKSICAYDFDGDNDIDIVSASQLDDKIVWHQNLNGQASFGSEKILTRSISIPVKSITSDIDNDGDKDVITISRGDGKISWYKNLDGLGNFGVQNLIETEFSSFGNVVAIDFDGDGDIDIASGENNSNCCDLFCWYENVDGQGKFSSRKVISGYLDGVVGLASADMDNDGDNDIIRTSGWSNTHFNWYKNIGQGLFQKLDIYPSDNTYEYGFGNVIIIKDINGDGNKDIVLQYGTAYSSTFSWFLNDGVGNFTEKRLAASFYNGHSFGAEDIDGDGDIDLVSANLSSYYGNNRIVWYENLDGKGNFGPVKIIDPLISGSSFSGFSIEIQLKDLDSDGDIDIIGRSDNNSNIVWYENLDGKGNFAPYRVLITETGYKLNSIFLDDLNKDGYVDILLSIVNDNYLNTVKTDKIIYYKNLGPAFNKINGFVRAGLDIDDCNLPVNNLKIITNNGTDTISTFTTKTGYYQFYVNPGTYVTKIPSTLQNFNVSAPTSHNSTFTNIGNIDVANFCLYPSQIVNDLNLVLIPLSQARPGFETGYQIVFNNVGNTKLSGKVKLVYDSSKVVFNSASIIPNLATINSLTFDYLNLNPFETRTINLNFRVLPPPTVEISNILVYSLSIDPIDNDATPTDNAHILNQIVIGSFDPNDITCLEGKKISLEEAKKELHYVIRFQNTGTASAINVKVENTLDEKLDWNTFQLINSSHTNRVEIKNGNKVSFIFDKINLTHSAANEVASHGFLAYKIKPKNNVESGDILPNKADIFFDYNLPIITNTALTEIEKTASNNEGASSGSASVFNFYTIIVSNVLAIKSENKIEKIEIYNELGQKVLSNSNQNLINVSGLSSGIYICSVTDVNGISKTKKIVK
jgi:hypothetical protein